MYNFTSSTWTVEDTDRKREGLARISDTELLSELEAGAYHVLAAGVLGRPAAAVLRYPARDGSAGSLPKRGNPW
jgi:hypothetical protein